jgi:cobaltochelatase CobS
MTEKEITLAILALGQGRIVGAFKKLHPTDIVPAVNPNGHCAKVLAQGVAKGFFTLDDIKSAPVHVTATGAAVDPAMFDAIGAVANRAETIALESKHHAADALAKASNAIKIAMNVGDMTKASLNDFAEKLQTEREIAVNVNPAIVETAVTKLIAKEFDSFKRAVADAKAEEVIADMTAVHVVDRRSALDVFGFDIRNRKGDPVMVDIWNHPAAPAIDPHWVWSEKILRAILTVQGTHDNLFFGGQKGTGKSQTAEQFAAYTGRAFTRFQFTKHTSAFDFMGSDGMTKGDTVFKKGAVLAGLTSPSTVVLLDEISMTDAGELAVLNGFLEPNPCISYGGQVHRRAAGVLVFGADNTLTSGDESGLYGGTRRLNTATAERFASVIKFEHMPAAMEIDIVVRRTGCPKGLATHVVKALNTFRAKVESGDIVDAPSIRQTMYFIKNLQLMTVEDAWAAAIGNRQPSESAAAVQAIKTACISDETIEKYLTT